MRLLVIDAGNSGLKAGIFVDFFVSAAGVFESPEDLFGWAGETEGIAVSSVVPRMTEALTEAFPSALFLNKDNAGIRIFYRDPAKLGSDRIANALYVKHFLSQNTVVADLGTAVTVDAIGADGTFYGGVIFPGPQTAIASLAERTSLLPRISLGREPVGPLGRDTETGMRSGVLWSTAMAVEGFAKAQAAFLGWENYRLVLTGGMAGLIRPLLKARCFLEVHATLLGLGAWAQGLLG
jgi:type III pantothenate kinase